MAVAFFLLAGEGGLGEEFGFGEDGEAVLGEDEAAAETGVGEGVTVAQGGGEVGGVGDGVVFVAEGGAEGVDAADAVEADEDGAVEGGEELFEAGVGRGLTGVEGDEGGVAGFFGFAEFDEGEGAEVAGEGFLVEVEVGDGEGGAVFAAVGRCVGDDGLGGGSRWRRGGRVVHEDDGVRWEVVEEAAGLGVEEGEVVFAAGGEFAFFYAVADVFAGVVAEVAGEVFAEAFEAGGGGVVFVYGEGVEVG